MIEKKSYNENMGSNTSKYSLSAMRVYSENKVKYRLLQEAMYLDEKNLKYDGGDNETIALNIEVVICLNYIVNCVDRISDITFLFQTTNSIKLDESLSKFFIIEEIYQLIETFFEKLNWFLFDIKYNMTKLGSLIKNTIMKKN